MKKHDLYYILFSVLLLGVATNGNATTVSYNISNVGGIRWEYTYSITNNRLAADIEVFEVSFDLDLGRYDNLMPTSTPAGWESFVTDPSPSSSGGDGSYYASVITDNTGIPTGGGIVPGNRLGGFSVQFDYFSTGIPDYQIFRIIEIPELTFDFTVDDGYTIASPVPLPPALWLFVSGIAMLVSQRKVFHNEALLA